MKIETVMVSIPYEEFTKLYEINNKLSDERLQIFHILHAILTTQYDKKTISKDSCAGMFDYYFVSKTDMLYPLFKLYNFNITEPKDTCE